MRTILLTIALAAAFLTSLPAQTVHIVTRNVEPFSYEQDGRRIGFAMELWDSLAKELHVQYDTKVVGTPKEMVEAVQAKTADVGVGALSITAEREKIIDFSQPFFAAGQQIVVPKVSDGGGSDAILSAVSSVLNWKFLGSFALLIFVMLVISHLVWMYEHRINEEMWPKGYLAGMWESFWWTISTLLVGGADNKGPVGVGGRIVAIAWMLLSIVLVSLLTASFASTLTVNTLQGDINGPKDLRNKAVATVKDSASVGILKDLNANYRGFEYDSAKLALDALKAGKVKAVVYDAPMLQFLLTDSNYSGLTAVGGEFDILNYGFALQQDSTIRERLNQALLTLSENGTTAKLREKYFGAQP
ncbi:MAG: transporter substrate-binding domain-containing protein [Chthoniobacterales bacterium]